MVDLRDLNISAQTILPDDMIYKMKNMTKMLSSEKKQHTIEYKVISKTDDYEERRYPASTWVCTTVTGIYQDTAKIEGFRHLQTYAQGHNSASARMSMQPPILTRVSSDSGDGFDRKFVVSTYLCSDHSGEHPVPNSQNVYLEHLPEMTVFVRNFEGISCEEKWTYETKRLAEVLRNKEDIRTDFYITCTYESPFQLVSSRNEIWFLKFDRKDSNSDINSGKKMLKYGSQKVEVPHVMGWLLQIVMVYLTVMFFVARSALSGFVSLRDNWDSVKHRMHLVLKIARSHVSVSGLIRSAGSIMWVVWSLVLALISGVGAETPGSSRRRKVHKRF